MSYILVRIIRFYSRILVTSRQGMGPSSPYTTWLRTANPFCFSSFVHPGPGQVVEEALHAHHAHQEPNNAGYIAQLEETVERLTNELKELKEKNHERGKRRQI